MKQIKSVFLEDVAQKVPVDLAEIEAWIDDADVPEDKADELVDKIGCVVMSAIGRAFRIGFEARENPGQLIFEE